MKNGSAGVVAAVDHDRDSLVVDFHKEGRITLPNTYLSDGGLDYGYARTMTNAKQRDDGGDGFGGPCRKHRHHNQARMMGERGGQRLGEQELCVGDQDRDVAAASTSTSLWPSGAPPHHVAICPAAQLFP